MSSVLHAPNLGNACMTIEYLLSLAKQTLVQTLAWLATHCGTQYSMSSYTYDLTLLFVLMYV